MQWYSSKKEVSIGLVVALYVVLLLIGNTSLNSRAGGPVGLNAGASWKDCRGTYQSWTTTMDVTTYRSPTEPSYGIGWDFSSKTAQGIPGLICWNTNYSGNLFLMFLSSFPNWEWTVPLGSGTSGDLSNQDFVVVILGGYYPCASTPLGNLCPQAGQWVVLCGTVYYGLWSKGSCSSWQELE